MFIMPHRVNRAPVKPTAEQEQAFYEAYTPSRRRAVLPGTSALLMVLAGLLWLGGGTLLR